MDDVLSIPQRRGRGVTASLERRAGRVAGCVLVARVAGPARWLTGGEVCYPKFPTALLNMNELKTRRLNILNKK